MSIDETVRYITENLFELDDVTGSSHFTEDLGLDQSGIAELIGQLNAALDIDIPLDKAREFTTVRSLADYIEEEYEAYDEDEGREASD
ncbi:hypothetical protein BDW62DRAFT_192023 [Aspergillus aurantiobrunneus]